MKPGALSVINTKYTRPSLDVVAHNAWLGSVGLVVVFEFVRFSIATAVRIVGELGD